MRSSTLAQSNHKQPGITCQQPAGKLMVGGDESTRHYSLPLAGLGGILADDPKTKWQEKKRKTAELSACFLKKSDKKLRGWGLRMSECASRLSFAYEKKSGGGWKRRLDHARLCRVRTCPICQWRRSLRLGEDLARKIRAIRKDNPDIKATLLTFTVRNCPIEQLRETAQAMLRAWSKQTRRKSLRHCVGWVRALEVTPGKRGKAEAHPHIHALVLHTVPISHNDLFYSQEWKEVMGLDYVPVCDATEVRDFDGAIAEVAKYMVKQASADEDWIADIALQLDGIRAFGSGGILRTVTGERLDLDDEADGVELPALPEGVSIPPWCTVVLVGYRWRAGFYQRDSYTLWAGQPPDPPPGHRERWSKDGETVCKEQPRRAG